MNIFELVLLLIFCGFAGLFSFFFGTIGSAIFELHKSLSNLFGTVMGFTWLLGIYTMFEDATDVFYSAAAISGFIGFAIGLLWGLKIQWDIEKGQ